MKKAKAKKTKTKPAKQEDLGLILLRQAIDRNTAAIERMAAAFNDAVIEPNEPATPAQATTEAPANGPQHAEEHEQEHTG